MTIAPIYENSELRIPEGTLVVLSGLPGSGKSHLKLTSVHLERVTWLSADELRDSISPALPILVDGKERRSRNEETNEEVFAIIRLRIQAGLRMGRTVVVDATTINDTARQSFIDIAEKLGAPHLVVILDSSVETCIKRANERLYHVPEHTIRNMFQPPEPEIPVHIIERAAKNGKKPAVTFPQGFMSTSRFNHVVLKKDDTLHFTWKELPTGLWDVIGDTHGLFDELKLLLSKAGWSIVNDRLLPHPQGRKLLLLGDLVDRGTQSVELVRFIKNAVDDGLAIALKGNHEAKLVRFIDTALNGGIEKWTSYANAETGMQFLALDPDERNCLIEFLRHLPHYVVDNESKTVFLHANVHTFVPGASILDEAVYGISKWKPMDTDAMYEERFAAGINQYTLVRGHIPQTSEQAHVFSLERHPFQKGELVLMRLDAVSSVFRESTDPQERIAAFKASLVTQKCEFDFEAYSQKFTLGKGLSKLADDKAVFTSRDASGMFKTYKYSKATFWNNSWGDSPLLFKARGIVLDPAGKIVSHPFDKVFNYLENETGKDLSDDMAVIVPEKLNGFLGIISAHPLKKGDLLVHTQGSFESDFVGYIRDHLSSSLKGQVCKYLSRNDVTLTFEVIHASDPHIVDYDVSMQGLHLLGVRGKQATDVAWTEAQVDEAALAMGLRRPSWSRMTFGEARTRLRESKGEGFMIRADTPFQEFLMKMKSPFYLTTKFLGRMSMGKAKHMYGNPADFKKTIDEEFYVIVDAILKNYTVDTFTEMADETRVAAVRDLINAMQ
ncbi:MAG: RNA ligase [Agitococcus sp.]|nr:RNA ligase [Agitococcus sp.]